MPKLKTDVVETPTMTIVIEETKSKKEPKATKATAASTKKTKAKAAAETPAPKEEPKKPEPPKERPVLYEKISVVVAHEDKPITFEKGKKLLGWLEDKDNTFGDDYLIRIEPDEEGNGGPKVRCTNNIKNRPIYTAVWQTLKQQVLRKRWEFNGEPIIIGRTGILLNGQHSLVGLSMAVIEWRRNPDKYPQWETEPTMDKLIVFGVSEEDRVVNTMDTCKPRTLAEVIHRSEYLADVDKKDRRQMAKIADYTIRMLWHRTGAASDAFAPRRTHAESLNFLERHMKILKAVRHIYEENGTDGRIGQYLAPGYASAMMYLMATSDTERETKAMDGYLQVDSPSERQLNFSLWEEAAAFWVAIAAGAKEMNALREALGASIERGGGTVAERTALIVRGWLSYRANGEIDPSDLILQFVTDPDTGRQALAECPSVGGVDLGNPTA